MKVYKISESDMYKIYKKDDVKNRIYSLANGKLAPILYGFYLCLISDGYISVKNSCKKTTFYRNIRLLKEFGIDFNQAINSIHLEDNLYIPFDLLSMEEVL